MNKRSVFTLIALLATASARPENNVPTAASDKEPLTKYWTQDSLNILRNDIKTLYLNNESDVLEIDSNDNLVLVPGDAYVEKKVYSINANRLLTKQVVCDIYKFELVLFATVSVKELRTPTTRNCSEEIVALIDESVDKVFISGIKHLPDLEQKLRNKALVPCPFTEVGATVVFSTVGYKLFFQIQELRNEVYLQLSLNNYNVAADIFNVLRKENETIASDIASAIFEGQPKQVLGLAYLIHQSEPEAIAKYFPKGLEDLFSGNNVTMKDREFGQLLHLSTVIEYQPVTKTYIKAIATIKKHAHENWKIIPAPAYVDGKLKNLYFKLNNTAKQSCLSLEATRISVQNGNRTAVGVDCESNSALWTLEPFVDDNQLAYILVNRQYRQPLNLPSRISYGDGDRIGYGHDDDDVDFAYGNLKRYQWIIKAVPTTN